ncbi:fungal specific transcription factor domain-containing protein [Arthroderma uncinatum]|uniref:fungal specific transcription factor domain-containing protein n=1 Tax=Arthroderma uncinatum TaxID=74035 RepID=UPI00144AB0CA|nr:fungal specific transcription factor domain-containing protein [Arthroderma uncinatum]KAF3484020.1 fungal specific transcription factor domain-containing protein [Arthroderma uncinatum]
MAQPGNTEQWDTASAGGSPVSQQQAANIYSPGSASNAFEGQVAANGSQLPRNEPASDLAGHSAVSQATTSTSLGAPPNPRSCVTCRRRKVRCNKNHPCSNCVKAKIECVYPSPGRAPRKSKKPRDTELLARLRTLENIVRNLGGPEAISGTGPILSNEISPGQSPNNKQQERETDGSGAVQQNAAIKNEDPGVSEIEENMGKLMAGEGGSQYVSHRFWTSFGKTVDDLKSILDPLYSDEDEDDTLDESVFDGAYGVNHDGFLFGFSSLAQSLRDFHPPLDKVDILWETYCQNIAPIVPIFHNPSLKPILYHGANNLDSLDKNTEVMMLSIYYTSIASMSASECLSRLGETRDVALGRYRFAVEQSLGRAKVLHSRNFSLLQGLVLFLMCVRQQDDSRYVWTMISIAYRIAQALGLQRDGTHFNLPPFETEMRRRLWWHICILDIRSSEDHGCDPFIHETSYDTRLPLNINDEDIAPDSSEAPEEREGCAETSFFLIRCEIAVANRRLSFTPPNASCRMMASSYSIADREELINKLSTNLETRFIQHCDMTIPIHWVCATVSRLVIAKFWLMIHQPMVQQSPKNAIARETHDRLLMTSVEILEFSRLLETNVNTTKWSWLFKTHMQWHAVAFLLSELCVRPLCPGVDRAWRAINSVYEAWNIHSEKKNDMLWPAIRKLMARAVKFREKQLLQLSIQHAKASIDIHASCATTPSTDPSSTYLTSSSSPPQYLSEPTSYSHLNPDMQIDNAPLTQNYNFGAGPQLGTTPTGQWADPTAIPLSISQLDTSILSSASPSWSDWDQLVREFQLDVAQSRQANAPVVPGGVVLPDWFE